MKLKINLLLLLLNGTSCNQILYATHNIVSPIRPFSLPYQI